MDTSQASAQGGSGRCARCGAPLDGGRFCTNCGARVGTVSTLEHASSTDTAERVYAVPAHAAPHRRPGAGLWFAIAGVLTGFLVLGGWLLAHGHGGSSASPPPTTSSRVHHSSSSSASQSSQPTTPPTTQPTSQATPPKEGPATDVAGLAQASAPAHAPAGVDLDGRPVTFVAANLVDGDPQTCWRRPGDATGTQLTFRLDQPTRLTKVGLINGYAKIAFSGGHRYDWYHGNRRVLVVSWIFDDGTTIGQHLTDVRAMQTMTIDPVTTRTVRLRIDAVSPPGRGRASRNDTAISEVSLVGRTG